MFRKELADKLSQIFGLRKSTFDQPTMNATTGSYEQDTLFIQVDQFRSSMKEGSASGEVNGSLVVFAQMDKMPFGYFAKRIQQANADLTRNFFFFEIDLNPANSPARLQNISERRIKFIYWYSAQYDPEHGEMTSLDMA